MFYKWSKFENSSIGTFKCMHLAWMVHHAYHYLNAPLCIRPKRLSILDMGIMITCENRRIHNLLHYHYQCITECIRVKRLEINIRVPTMMFYSRGMLLVTMFNETVPHQIFMSHKFILDSTDSLSTVSWKLRYHEIKRRQRNIIFDQFDGMSRYFSLGEESITQFD